MYIIRDDSLIYLSICYGYMQKLNEVIIISVSYILNLLVTLVLIDNYIGSRREHGFSFSSRIKRKLPIDADNVRLLYQSRNERTYRLAAGPRVYL